MTPLYVILALVAILVIWIITVQRKLVSADELCHNSMSQIGVQQESRWDAVKALVELTRSYNEHEYNTLMEVVKARQEIHRNSSAKDADEQEGLITRATQGIHVLAEQYPALKASETYTKTMESLNTYENQVRMSRMIMNDSVTKYNRIVRNFPSNLVAAMLHFTLKEYLSTPDEKKAMPSVKI